MSKDNNKNLNIDLTGKTYSSIVIMGIVLLATFAGALMQTSLGTAIPKLMDDFDIDFSTAQQATTWFLLANGIMVPISAFLATRFSNRWLYIISYSVLLIGLIVTAIAPSESKYWVVFLFGRIITAIAVGIMLPLMQILILNMFPRNKRGVAMGLSGLAVGLAPAMGPTFAGWILNKNHIILGITITDSWRNIFVIPIIAVAIALVLSIFYMREIIPNRKIKFDFTSLILSCVGFGLFLWGFTNVSSKGWGDLTYVILPIVLSIILLGIFCIIKLKSADPFLNIRVFKSKGFTIATIGIITVTMAMYGVEMTLPTYLQNIHGLSPFKSGLTLLAGAVMLGLISPIAGSLYNKVGIKRLSFVGFSILTIASIPFAFLSETTSTTLILVLYAMRMFGVALVMMPLTTGAMDALTTEDATHGTAVNNTARQIASSIAVAVLTSITQNIINNNEPAHALKDANPLKYADHIQQASMDGFNTSFAIGIVFAIVGLLMVPFLRSHSSIDHKEGLK